MKTARGAWKVLESRGGWAAAKGASFLLLLCLTTFLAGFGEEKEGTVRARRFEVVDGEDRLRGILESDGDSVSLTMFDQKRRAVIGVGSAGNGEQVFWLAGKDGCQRLQLSVGSDAKSGVTLLSGNGEVRILLDAGDDKAGEIQVFDKGFRKIGGIPK